MTAIPHPAAILLLALLLGPATAQAQAAPPTQGPARQSQQEPSARELGESMGQLMEQMGKMMGGMAQSMGGGMQRMLDAMQKEAGLQGGKNEHIEGKLAFLKAELKITPAQEKAWESFAAAMRRAAAMTLPGGAGEGATLPERMDSQARLLQSRLAMLQAKKDAIDRLYAALSAEQKTLADDLIEQIGLA